MKERYQNPSIGEDVSLRLYTFNSNSKSDVESIEKIEIYKLEEENECNLITTITDYDHVDTGEYKIDISLESPLYTIGNYKEVWYLQLTSDPYSTSKIENPWKVYPPLWYATTVPIVHDFNFAISPNKIRQGTKRYISINVTPNVPNTSDLDEYYEYLAITSPIKITIEQLCGDCLPEEEDLRMVIEKASIDYRNEKSGYYFLDTEEMDAGIYNVWFDMEIGESLFISDKQQIQIFN